LELELDSFASVLAVILEKTIHFLQLFGKTLLSAVHILTKTQQNGLVWTDLEKY